MNPQDDPTYHSGWRTTPWVFAVRYVLDRSAVYTVDAGGHVRARPPRNVGISRRHHLVARQIRWRGWGQQETHGHGVVRFRERTYRVDVSFSNPELGGDPEGGVPRCRVGRAYYQDLFVRVPAWHRAAGYTLTSRCQDSAVNNIQGDLRPPGG